MEPLIATQEKAATLIKYLFAAEGPLHMPRHNLTCIILTLLTNRTGNWMSFRNNRLIGYMRKAADRRANRQNCGSNDR